MKRKIMSRKEIARVNYESFMWCRSERLRLEKELGIWRAIAREFAKDEAEQYGGSIEKRLRDKYHHVIFKRNTGGA